MTDLQTLAKNTLPRPYVRALRQNYRRMRRVRHAMAGAAPRAKVVMMHVGRSGSTVLGNMLHKHSEVFWDNELYHTAHYGLGVDFDRVPYADWTRAQFAFGGQGVYGFECKIHPDQHLSFFNGSPEAFFDDMRRIGVTHFILLERRNILRRMTSQYVGAKTAVRHLDSSEAARVSKVVMDCQTCHFGDRYRPKTLLACMEEVDGVYRAAHEAFAGEAFLPLVYEEDIDGAEGPARAVGRIFDLLDLPSEGIRPDLSKTNPFPLREIIENFDEVSEHLAGTRFAWMLDE